MVRYSWGVSARFGKVCGRSPQLGPEMEILPQTTSSKNAKSKSATVNSGCFSLNLRTDRQGRGCKYCFRDWVPTQTPAPPRLWPCQLFDSVEIGSGSEIFNGTLEDRKEQRNQNTTSLYFWFCLYLRLTYPKKRKQLSCLFLAPIQLHAGCKKRVI